VIFGNENQVVGMPEQGLHIRRMLPCLPKLLRLDLFRPAVQLCMLAPGFFGGFSACRRA